jgi:hypothetical protein
MPFVNSAHNAPQRHTSDTLQIVLVRVSLCLALSLASVSCSQQIADSGTVSPAQSASAPSVGAVIAGPKWQELTQGQRLILKPLTTTWDSLDGTSKSKWIAIALSFPSRSPAEQQRMQERMVEWTALTPAARERARLNFAGTKKLSPAERSADWEAYQGLSSQEKKAFAKAANDHPGGAAIATTTIQRDKLTPVPVTRHTPVNDDASVATRPSLNPKTLLPTPPTLAEPVIAPTAVPASAQEGSSGGQLLDKSLTIN